MPSWVVAVAGTFALSMVSAYIFLRLRCRRAGHPFGPRAKWWAAGIVVITATVSTGLGVAWVAASHHIRAVYAGLLLPSGLWLGESLSRRSHQRDSQMPRRLFACLTLPLRRLNDRMVEDLQDWCEVRAKVVWQRPRQMSEAVQYYYNQVTGRLKDVQALQQLDYWRQSIAHKTKIVLLIDRRADPDEIRDALQSHPDTENMRKYDADDLKNLARRLEADAGNEMLLFLASLYRHGYRKLLIYPARTRGRY